MKRSNRIKKLDRIWSKLVLERDNYICQDCGLKGEDPHHIMLRDYLNTRFDLDNGITLCRKCHIEQAHGHIEEFNEWARGKVGVETYERLQEAKRVLKVDLDYWEERLNGTGDK